MSRWMFRSTWLVSRSSLTRDLGHILTSRKVEKLLSALAVLMGTAGAANSRYKTAIDCYTSPALLTGSVTSIDRKAWMSGKVIWSQASKAAAAVSGITSPNSVFRRIHRCRCNAISPRNFSSFAASASDYFFKKLFILTELLRYTCKWEKTGWLAHAHEHSLWRSCR